MHPRLSRAVSQPATPDLASWPSRALPRPLQGLPPAPQYRKAEASLIGEGARVGETGRCQSVSVKRWCVHSAVLFGLSV